MKNRRRRAFGLSMIFLAVVSEQPSERSHGPCSPQRKLLLFAFCVTKIKEEMACLEPCLTCSFLPNVLLFLEFYPRESRLTAVVETFHSQRLPPAARSLDSLLYFLRNGVERETFQPNLTAAGVVEERWRCMHAYGVLFLTCVWFEV